VVYRCRTHCTVAPQSVAWIRCVVLINSSWWSPTTRSWRIDGIVFITRRYRSTETTRPAASATQPTGNRSTPADRCRRRWSVPTCWTLRAATDGARLLTATPAGRPAARRDTATARRDAAERQEVIKVRVRVTERSSPRLVTSFCFRSVCAGLTGLQIRLDYDDTTTLRLRAIRPVYTRRRHKSTQASLGLLCCETLTGVHCHHSYNI